MMETARKAIQTARPVTNSGGEYAHSYPEPQPLEWPEPNIKADDFKPGSFKEAKAPQEPEIPDDLDKRTFVSNALGRVAAKFIRRGRQVEKIVKLRGEAVTVTGEDKEITLPPDAPSRDWRRLEHLKGKSERLYFKHRRELQKKHVLVGRSESTNGLTDMKQMGKNAYYQKGLKEIKVFKEPHIRGGTYYYTVGNQTRSVHYTYNEPALLPIDPENMSPEMIKKIEAENEKRRDQARDETIKKLKQELERRDPYAAADYNNPIDARTDPFEREIVKDLNQKVDDSIERRRSNISRDVEIESIQKGIVQDEVNEEDQRKLELGKDGLSGELQKLVDAGNITKEEATSELGRIELMRFDIDRKVANIYNQREDHADDVETEIELLYGGPLSSEDRIRLWNGESLKKDLMKELKDGDITQSEYDTKISRINYIAKIERKAEEKIHIREIANDSSYGGFGPIKTRIINEYIATDIDKINERIKRIMKNKSLPEPEKNSRLKNAEDEKKNLWSNGRLLILSDSDLHRELQQRVSDGKLAAVKLPEEMYRIKTLKKRILSSDFSDMLQQDLDNYNKLKAEREGMIDELLNVGLDTGKKKEDGSPDLERYEKPLSDLDNPDEAIRRINEAPYSPWKKRSEAKQLRKWIKTHQKAKKLDDKRRKILTGEDWTAKRINLGVKARMNIAGGAFRAQGGVDAAHKKTLELRKQAKQKYINFKNGELNIPSIDNLDLTPEARHRHAHPRSTAGANVLPRTSRRGIIWEAGKHRVGEKAGKAAEKTKEKLKAAKDWPANPKLEKVDGLNIPRSEPKARNPNLEPRYPANTEPPANRLPRTNRPGETLKKIKQRAAYHRKIAKNIKKGDLDKIQDLDLRS